MAQGKGHNPELEVYRCDRCHTRLFDYKLLEGVLILEAKCPKNGCGFLNTIKVGIARG
jgi:hypothetical protein